MLIRIGEALGVGWSRNMLYSGFNILPRSVFWSAYFNGRSDNTDVIPLDESLVDANSATGNTRRPTLGCIAVALLTALGFYLAFYFSPLGQHLRYYGPAEEIVNELVMPLRNDLLDGDVCVDALLDMPKYSELRNRVIAPVADSGEIVRFHMNEMFEIGLHADGSIIWHKN